MNKLGFVEEAKLRMQNLHNGQWVDENCFGLLKVEYLKNT